MEELNWEEEARAVIDDITSCVASASLSVINSAKDFENRIAYINIQTKEGESITVKLDPEGFSIVGRKFDDKGEENLMSQKYETIYALLHSISPTYSLMFAENLSEKLMQLNGKPADT